MSTPRRRIKPLDAAVVNRIAAGEIIVAPANALKELLENALDAGASQVDVVVKEGGLRLLRISDDGCGIAKDDLPLLCRRFATSKMQQFEDLESIATYGFRGEALASVSHISHLSVVTKTADSPCAWCATYVEGELTEVKPAAGKQGTQIIVEDLFYNVPSRLRSIRGGAEEFAKIVDVVGRYAIHTDLGYGVKKFGDSHFSLSTRPQLGIKERIRSIFGNSIAQELIPFSLETVEQYGVVKVEGHITNPNYNSKKSVAPVFFINDRLVSNDRLRRALNSTIQHFLPKGHKPFIYCSLQLNPAHLDVNVHPTKREVKFLHEDEITDLICLKVREQLMHIDQSRSFPTQSLLPQLQQKRLSQDGEDDAQLEQPPQSAQKKVRLDYKLVRTDASQAKITNYMRPGTQSSQLASSQYIAALPQTLDDSVPEEESSTVSSMVDDREAGTDITTINETTLPLQHKYTPLVKPRVIVNLQSILELREEAEDSADEKLTELFSNFSYIGLVDGSRRICAVQHGVKLLMVNYAGLLYEFFYQVALQDFQNFGVINLQGESLKVRSLLENCYSQLQNPPTINLEECMAKLTSMSDMLEEYFSIKITTDHEPTIVTIPLLVKDYVPNLTKISHFLYGLGAMVDWEDEKICLKGILKQLALLHTPVKIDGDNANAITNAAKQMELTLNETMENILMPLVKRRFLAPTSMRAHVHEMANLPGLYKVFERC